MSYPQFARLRLRRFVPASLNVVEHDGFEWMNGLWRYEGVGFTWFGRLEHAPDDTAGLELAFDEIPGRAAERILYRVGIPVFPGINLDQLVVALGKPIRTDTFVEDRRTHTFFLGAPSSYEVGCTIHESHGLIHLSMIREDVRQQLEVA